MSEKVDEIELVTGGKALSELTDGELLAFRSAKARRLKGKGAHRAPSRVYTSLYSRYGAKVSVWSYIGDNGGLVILMLLAGVPAFFLPWGVVRIVGWVVEGFRGSDDE